MATINKSIFIKASTEEVFQYAIHWQQWEDWFVGVSEFRPTVEQAFGEGSRFAYKTKMMGFTINVETEIIDFRKNEGWRGQATKGMPHQTQWQFEPVEGGTQFSYILTYDLPLGFLSNFVDNQVMKPQWEKIIEASLKNFKEWIESS